MLCGWGVKAGMARVWWQVKLCEPLYNTCHGALEARVWSCSLPFEGDAYSGYILFDCTFSLVIRGYVTVYLTSGQFNFRLKFCLYTTVHRLL